MINAVYKKYGLKINAIWFCDDKQKALENSNADLIFFHGTDKNIIKNCIVNSQYTLTTNLKDAAEDIFKQINKGFRYEINRSRKENIKCMVYNSKDLVSNPSVMQSFKNDYSNFVKLKRISNAYNENAMKVYIENGNVLLTKAFQGEEIYAQHVYVCDNKNVRLLYSVSNFRIERLDRNLIGRANKYLHWYDIQYFKDNQFRLLDWGGISDIDKPNGVDLFKIGFGGKNNSYYNIIAAKSLFGRLAILAIKLNKVIACI